MRSHMLSTITPVVLGGICLFSMQDPGEAIAKRGYTLLVAADDGVMGVAAAAAKAVGGAVVGILAKDLASTGDIMLADNKEDDELIY